MGELLKTQNGKVWDSVTGSSHPSAGRSAANHPSGVSAAGESPARAQGLVGPSIHRDEMSPVIGTSVELGTDMTAALLEQPSPVARCAVRGDEGVDVVCGDFVLPDPDVHATMGARRDRAVEVMAGAPRRPGG